MRTRALAIILAGGILSHLASYTVANAQLTFDVTKIRSHRIQVDGRHTIPALARLPQGPQPQIGEIHPPLEVEDRPRHYGTSTGPATNVRVPAYSIAAPTTLRSFPTTPSLTGLQPPDPVLAVGPNHVVTTTNEGIRVHDLDGNTLSFVAWPNFFPATVGGVTAGTFSDPQILYDHYHSRWLLAMTCYDIASQVGRVWVVRSSGPDPNGGWDGFRLSMRTGDDPGDFRFLIDYPRLAMNDDTIYLTGALFSYPDFRPSGSRVMQIDLNALLLANPVMIGDTWTGFSTDVVCPAVMRTPQRYYGDPSWNVGYLVQAADNYADVVIVWRFATRWSAGATAFVDGYAVPVNFYYPPPAAYQYGGESSPYIDSGDCRIAGATFMNGILETTQQVGYDPMDGSGVCSAIKTYRWDTTSVGQPVLVRDQILYSGGTDLYYPSATLTIDGDSIWTLAASNPTMNAGLFTLAWRSSGLDGSFGLIKSGEDIYNRPPNRWGDYFGGALDPFDMRTVWVTGEYAKYPNSWGVWVAETNYKPFVTVAVANASGQPGGPATLNATVRRNGSGATESGGIVKFSLDDYYVGTAVTNTAGVASLDCVIPGALAEGLHTITATAERSTLLNAGVGYGVIQVGSVGTTITVPKVSAAVGQTVLLTATLARSTDKGGVAGKELSFAVDGVEVPGSPAVSDSAGKASVHYTPAPGTVGTHTISVAFAGDDSFGASTGSGTLTVGKAATAIAVPDVVGAVSSSVSLSATLTRTTDGAPIEGKAITFKMGTVSAGSAVTDSNGKATKAFTIPTGTPLGVQTITATFTGDVDHTGSTGTGSLTVKFRTTLSVASVTGVYGKVVNLKATLKGGSPSTPLPGQTILFKVDGLDVGTAQTISTGVATLAHVVYEDLGKHALTAEFAGDGAYGPAKGSGTLTVQSLTKITVDVLKAPAGSIITFGARLIRLSDDEPLPGRTLNFYQGTLLVGTASTDDNGRATILLQAPAAGVKVSITVKFAAETLYKASSGNGSVTGL